MSPHGREGVTSALGPDTGKGEKMQVESIRVAFDQAECAGNGHRVRNGIGDLMAIRLSPGPSWPKLPMAPAFRRWPSEVEATLWSLVLPSSGAVHAAPSASAAGRAVTEGVR